MASNVVRKGATTGANVRAHAQLRAFCALCEPECVGGCLGLWFAASRVHQRGAIRDLMAANAKSICSGLEFSSPQTVAGEERFAKNRTNRGQARLRRLYHLLFSSQATCGGCVVFSRVSRPFKARLLL